MGIVVFGEFASDHFNFNLKGVTFFSLPSHMGIVLFHTPGCWLRGATHVTVDKPFKRWPIAQEKLHSAP